jgi:type IV fimbrial biogenesis protein FimT
MKQTWHSCDRTSHRGVTLFELMLVITVAAVILGIAVPNFREFMLNTRMTGAVNDLHVGVHLARTESIKRSAQTVLCFSSDPSAAVPACDGDGTQGWIVFVDDDLDDVTESSDRNLQVDAGEEVILRHGALADTISVRSVPTGNAGYIAFNRSGFTITATNDVESVVMCDGRGNRALDGGDLSAARALQLSNTGRPRVTRSVADIDALGGCP